MAVFPVNRCLDKVTMKLFELSQEILQMALGSWNVRYSKTQLIPWTTFSWPLPQYFLFDNLIEKFRNCILISGG